MPWAKGGHRGQGLECVGSQHLSHFATPQQLVMCFFSQEPDPISCKQQAENTYAIAQKEGVSPPGWERKETNPAAKNFRIGKHFLGFKHLENYKVNRDFLVGCT